jgi:hypothetical protein
MAVKQLRWHEHQSYLVRRKTSVSLLTTLKSCTIALMNGDDSQQPQPVGIPQNDPPSLPQATAPSATPPPSSLPPQSSLPPVNENLPSATQGIRSEETEESASQPAVPTGIPTLEQPTRPAVEPLSWAATATASQRPKSWSAGLYVIALIAAVLVYIITKGIFSSLGIMIVAVLMGVVYTKKPQVIHYAIDLQGITIGQNHYSFDHFRAFSIVDDHGHVSIALMPLKRFSPILSVFYDPTLQKQIVDTLAVHLPLTEYRQDAIDKITSGIRL